MILSSKHLKNSSLVKSIIYNVIIFTISSCYTSKQEPYIFKYKNLESGGEITSNAINNINKKILPSIQSTVSCKNSYWMRIPSKYHSFESKDATKEKFLIKKIDNDNLGISKIYIMGALPSLDSNKNIIKVSGGITVYTYTIICELLNRGLKNITKKDDLYLEYAVFHHERKDLNTHLKIYKWKKKFLKNMKEFGSIEKIKMPIEARGGVRLVEIIIPEIPESENKIGLFIRLRSHRQIWSSHYLALHKPVPPLLKEGPFDFLTRPTSTRWWYLTLTIGLLALILAFIALI